MKYFILVTLFISLISCRDNRNESLYVGDKVPGEKITSSTKQYHLTTFVNDFDRSQPGYGDVVIHLHDSSGYTIDTINTGAGDFSKWAVGWHSQGDTVLLYSSDIGTLAWKIEEQKLIPTKPHAEILRQARALKEKKYGDN